MSNQEWFRNQSWNSKIEKAFFEKLSRARSQRDQYLAIQALELAPHDPNAALALVDHYFETREDDFHDITVLSARADASEALGDTNGLVAAYKAILAREAEEPGHRTLMTWLMFPYLVASEGLEDEYDLAKEILNSRIEGNRDGLELFPLAKFYWHASHALLASRQGDCELAKKHAVAAMDSAQATRSGARYHPNMGLVGNQHQPVIDRLAELMGE